MSMITERKALFDYIELAIEKLLCDEKMLKMLFKDDPDTFEDFSKKRHILEEYMEKLKYMKSYLNENVLLDAYQIEILQSLALDLKNLDYDE
jgi:hypothetical protein